MPAILEIGTGNGRLTLALAESAPGQAVMTMEADPAKAAEARRRFAEAGCADRIHVIVGEPSRFLHKLRGPFDLIYVNVPEALAPPRERLSTMLRAGGVIVTRNDDKILVNDMTIAEWLAQAKADAEKRGLPELFPMLEGLAQASDRLRKADWNDNPDTDTPVEPNAND